MTDEDLGKISEIVNSAIDRAYERFSEKLDDDREKRKKFLEKEYLPKVGNNIFSRIKMFVKDRLNTAEVAEILGIKVASVDKKVERGEIRSHRDANGHYYFFRHELEEDIFSYRKNSAD